MKDFDLKFYLAKLKEYKELVLVIILIAILSLFILRFVGGSSIQLLRNIKHHVNWKFKISEQTKEYKRKEDKIKKDDEENKDFNVFKAEYSEEVPFNAFDEMFESVMDNISKNSELKIKSFNYSLTSSAPAVNSNLDTYAPCSLEFEMVGEYSQLKNFFEKLYQYPYFIAVKEFAVQPYVKNPDYIIIKLKLELYVQKTNVTEKEEVKDIESKSSKDKSSKNKDVSASKSQKVPDEEE